MHFAWKFSHFPWGIHDSYGIVMGSLNPLWERATSRGNPTGFCKGRVFSPRPTSQFLKSFPYQLLKGFFLCSFIKKKTLDLTLSTILLIDFFCFFLFIDGHCPSGLPWSNCKMKLLSLIEISQCSVKGKFYIQHG